MNPLPLRSSLMAVGLVAALAACHKQEEIGRAHV